MECTEHPAPRRACGSVRAERLLHCLQCQSRGPGLRGQKACLRCQPQSPAMTHQPAAPEGATWQGHGLFSGGQCEPGAPVTQACGSGSHAVFTAHITHCFVT